MSTKCTIAYSQKPQTDFHFYKECFDDEHVYFELRGDDIEFEAESKRVMIRIPLEIWEVIRQRAPAPMEYADWTDEQIDAAAELLVDERINEYREAQEKGKSFDWLRILGADRPREQQIAEEQQEHRQLRDTQAERKRRIEAIEAEDPHD